MNGFPRRSTVLFFAALLVGAGSLAGQEAVQLPADEGTYPTGTLFLQELDTIWTAAGEVLVDASILIEDGVIRQIGPGLSPPEGVEVVDGRGLTAIPGIVDEHSHIAMRATNEGTAPVVPEVKVLDALDPEDFGIFRALTGGVTTARIMHGSSNPIGGQSAVIKTRWGMDRSDQLLVPGAPRFVKFALGENVTRKNRRAPDRPVRFPASRQGVEAVYDQAFTAARRYRSEWEAYREDPDAFRVPPRRDLRLEALVDIMEGRIRVHAHSYRSDEILALMRMAERHGFRIDVFTHVLEGYRVAPEIREHGAGASTFSDWWQFKLEAYEAIPHNAALLHEAGVLTAINSDIPWLQSFMIREIPKPVKWGGVSREEALRMLTLNPARMMSVDDRVGSLEVGKEGDVVLLSGSPFDAFTRVEKTVVDGIIYYDLFREEETRGEPILPLPEVDLGGGALAEAGTGIGGESGEGSSDPGSGSGVRSSDDRSSSLSTGDQVRNAATGSEREPVALVGGTVHPGTAPPIPDGVVVIRAGRITAVGSADEVPLTDDLRRVDVSGRQIHPGMIDPVSQLGIFEFGQVPSAFDILETGRFNPHIRAISAVHPHGVGIPVARANGITAALVAQASGIVQGTAGVIQLHGDTWERAALEEEAALMVDFPAPREPRRDRSWVEFADDHDEVAGGRAADGKENGAAVGSRSAVGPRSGVGAARKEEDPEPNLEGEEMEALVELFQRARRYTERPTVHRDPTAPFWPNVDAGDTELLEAMAPVMGGEVPIFFRAQSEWQIRTLFRFLDEFPGVRGVVVGGAQAFRVADELARREIPVILTSTLSPTPDRDDSITASFRNPAILHDAGVRIAFGSDSSANSRWLPWHAAQAVAFGLPRDVAYRAVSLGPAEILGIGHRTGSLEVGKRADLIVTDEDPLQVIVNVERMWIGGVEVDPAENKHDRLFREFRDRR